MYVFDSRDVAAAVLAEAGVQLHYVDITDRVMRTNLSDLGRRGSTPEQTMGVILRKEGLFEHGDCPGFYRLRNPAQAATQWRVRSALEQLHRRKTA